MKIIFDDDEFNLPPKRRLKYLQHLLKMHPIEVLEGEKIRNVSTCPECKNTFFVTNEKRRIYCSTVCAYRYLSRQRRERLRADPVKYKRSLKKQREHMKIVYARRRAAIITFRKMLEDKEGERWKKDGVDPAEHRLSGSMVQPKG